MVTSHLAAAPPDAVVIAASRGDAELFGVIYDRYAASLYRYAYRRLGPEHAVTEGDGLRAGDVLSSTAVLSVAIVDSSPVERSTHA